MKRPLLTYLSFALISCTFGSLISYASYQTIQSLGYGFVAGVCLFCFYFVCDRLALHKLSIKAFTTVLLGVILGLFLGKATFSLITNIFPHSFFNETAKNCLQATTYLFVSFVSIATLLRTSGKTYIQLPFIKLSSLGTSDKSLILTPSFLGDTRSLELIRSGILKQHLLVPSFVKDELPKLPYDNAKQASDLLMWLEQEAPQWGISFSMPELTLPTEIGFSEKIRKACKLYQADILVLDKSSEHTLLPPGCHTIALNHLAHLLKPTSRSEETLNIKIQRIGKEPGQGIGYLEDGTMVVVNGGGAHVGEEVLAWVISTKHSSSGRIIFSNLMEKRSYQKNPQLIEA